MRSAGRQEVFEAGRLFFSRCSSLRVEIKRIVAFQEAVVALESRGRERGDGLFFLPRTTRRGRDKSICVPSWNLPLVSSSVEVCDLWIVIMVAWCSVTRERVHGRFWPALEQ